VVSLNGVSEKAKEHRAWNGVKSTGMFIRVLITKGAHFQRYEVFDVGDADQALARFEELCAEWG
jgi:hypothetical protein